MTSRPFRVGIVAICISTSVGLVNFIVFVNGMGSGKSALFTFLGGVQCAAAAVAAVAGIMLAFGRSRRRSERIVGALLAAGGTALGLGAFVAVVLGRLVSDPKFDVMGPPWGRPLRLRGRVLHPALRLGSNWTRGAAPDVRGVDPVTREALEQILAPRRAERSTRACPPSPAFRGCWPPWERQQTS